MKNDVECSATRPGTEKQLILPAVSPSLISCGTIELKILRFMFSNPDVRFNIRAFFRDTDIARTTITDALNRLISKGLVERPHFGAYKISEAGISFVDVAKGVAGDSRRGCRDGGVNLSQHYSKFVMPIRDRSGFSESCLKGLNWKVNRLMNLVQYHVYFDGVTVTINPKQVVFRVHDLVSDDSEDNLFVSFHKALSFVPRVEALGVRGEGFVFESAHFARVNSVFAEFLEKLDSRFFVDLGEGRKFWVDFSDDKREDETNDVQLRNRIDEFIKDLPGSESTFSDVDKLKLIVSDLVKLELLKLKNKGVENYGKE